MRRWLVLVAAVFGVGCSCGALRVEPMMTSADAVWAGVDGFCARDAEGLSCWRSEEGIPRRVRGLEGEVTDVAFMINQVCALDAAGVACWSPLEPTALRMRALGEVRELRSLSGWRGRFCVLDAEGRVACWRRPDEAPAVIEPEGIAHLHVAIGGDMICAETTDAAVRCHELDDELAPVRTIECPRITPPLRRVGASTISGEVWVLDADGLKHGRGQSAVVAANPFGDPLEATLREIPRQRVVVAPVAEARGVRELLGVSVWIYVQDDQGIRMVEDHLGRFEERERYDFGAPAEALLAAKEGLVFARAGGALVIRGRIDGERVARQVEVRDPVQVVVGLDRFCVRHADGVSCGPIPE